MGDGDGAEELDWGIWLDGIIELHFLLRSWRYDWGVFMQFRSFRFSYWLMQYEATK